MCQRTCCKNCVRLTATIGGPQGRCPFACARFQALCEQDLPPCTRFKRAMRVLAKRLPTLPPPMDRDWQEKVALQWAEERDAQECERRDRELAIEDAFRCGYATAAECFAELVD